MEYPFFRFPHTPHLAWLGAGMPRDDKVLSPEEARDLLADDVVVEEKVDGANLGLSLNAQGQLLAQNRGQYLAEPFTGQFSRLTPWLAAHAVEIASALTGGDLILFGEWCAAHHSLSYNKLPDWYLVFDVYDRNRREFWSTDRRDALASRAGLACVPRLAEGRQSLDLLRHLLTDQPSHFSRGPMEGLVIRRDVSGICEARAKLVSADFTQAIGMHWRKRKIEWNRLQPADAVV